MGACALSGRRSCKEVWKAKKMLYVCALVLCSLLLVTSANPLNSVEVNAKPNLKVSSSGYAPINVKPHSPPLGQGMGQGGD